jgi:hypothetical protein
MPSQLRVRFGEAEHGSLPVEVITPERTITFFASYIPFDSLSELTTALLQTVLTQTPYQVHWGLEPEVYRFTFIVPRRRCGCTSMHCLQQVRLMFGLRCCWTILRQRMRLFVHSGARFEH